jgi:hypothetical protein
MILTLTEKNFGKFQASSRRNSFYKISFRFHHPPSLLLGGDGGAKLGVIFPSHQASYCLPVAARSHPLRAGAGNS